MRAKVTWFFLMTVTSIFLMVIPSHSATLSSNGYEVTVNAEYKKKKSKFKIRGTVSGGEKCEQLNIHLSFIGSGKNKGFEKNILIENYSPEDGGVQFTAKKKSATGSKKDLVKATEAQVLCEKM